ncbi:IclR family transcriptional regulator [Aquabacter spiritensis]|nr:IclR family transcriptional regulator [Aquabacter spiritensis]
MMDDDGSRDLGAAPGTVVKALGLLDAFLDGAEALTLTELAAYSGLHKTTALRLCTSLEEAGMLQRKPGRPFRLGPKIWQLAQVYRRGFQLEELVRPILARIRDETGESVSFYVVEGRSRVCLFRENSKWAARHHVDEGARFPLDSGIAGPVLLAFMGQPGPQLEQIRSDGHLIGQGREPHTTSVAVPVFDTANVLQGALVVSGLTARFTEDRHAPALELLKRSAESIRQLSS